MKVLFFITGASKTENDFLINRLNVIVKNLMNFNSNIVSIKFTLKPEFGKDIPKIVKGEIHFSRKSPVIKQTQGATFDEAISLIFNDLKNAVIEKSIPYVENQRSILVA